MQGLRGCGDKQVGVLAQDYSPTVPFRFDAVTRAACCSVVSQKGTGADSTDQTVRRLLASATLINQAVGDAMSDLLFCEAVLRLKGWGCKV